MKRHIVRGLALLVLVTLGPGLLAAGGRREEVTADEAAQLRELNRQQIFERTVRRPGPPQYTVGRAGGTYVSTITNDPKSFNELNARDADTRAIVQLLTDYLADYDPYTREFKPNLATFEVQVDPANNKLRVVYTLREGLVWSRPNAPAGTNIPVTSDDVVFYYNEIEGDPEFQHPGYPGRFVDMPDGSRQRVTITRIDARRFAFDFPRIVANPILSSNTQVWPRHVFEPAKRTGGVQAVVNLLSVDTPPTELWSVGAYHLVEYTPGVRVVARSNPHYWKRDDAGNRVPYIQEVVYRIVPDRNTEYLLFREGQKDAYSVRPEDLDQLLAARNPDYTVYDGGPSLGSAFFVINQNPNAVNAVKLSWFARREFRQAMSSLLPRERIAAQVFRGLAEPAHHFAARANMFFDEQIRLQYTFNPTRAVELLRSIGITRRADGLMYDSAGNHIRFDIMVGVENNVGVDMVTIYADELKNVGITANVRPIDFQNLVERLTTTYDWDMVTVSLGANYWPSGGSNVWQSSGNFHLWHPLQSSPATPWEARLDYLYNEIRFTIDEVEAKRLYDEFQRIILTELPLFYVVYPYSYFAIRNRWGNVFYDTLGGSDSTYFYLRP